MKKTLGVVFIIVISCMLVLAIATHMATTQLIDPAIQELRSSMALAPPQLHPVIAGALMKLEKIQSNTAFFVPIFHLAIGLIMTIAVSIFVQKRLQVGPGENDRTAAKTKAALISAEQAERAKENATISGACQILATLQNKGRLIDFLQEDIKSYPDSQIGAAVRQIHQDCRAALDEYVTLVPVMAQDEGAKVAVAEGVNPSEIRLTGQITAGPPFQGTIQHPGWKVAKINLPSLPKGQNHMIIAPAEIEVGRTALQ